MAITRAQRESIWAHIIKTVMELDPNCQLVRALNRDGCTTMDLISTLNEDDIMQLEFVETPGTDTQAAILKPVIKYQLLLLTAFLDFVDYTQTTQANFTTLKDWMSITMEKFTEYRRRDEPAMPLHTPGLSILPSGAHSMTGKRASNET
jgi:hypothetical protein